MAKLLKHFGIGVKKSGSTGSSSSHRSGAGAEYNTQKSNSVQELLPKSPTRYRSSQSLSTAAAASSQEYDTHSLLKLYSAPAAAGAVPATDANHHQRLSCTINGRHEGHRGHSGGSSRSKEQKSLSPKASNSNESYSSYSGIEGTLLEEGEAFSLSPDPALAAEPPPQTATPPRLLDEYCDPLDLKKAVSDGTELLGAIAPTPALDDDYSVPYEVKKILKGVRPKERYEGTGPNVYGQPVNGFIGRSTEVNGCIMEDSFDEPWEWTTKLSALVAQNPSVYTPGNCLTPMMTPKKCQRGQQGDGGALFNGDKASVGKGLISPGSSEDDQANVSLRLEPKLGQNVVVNETKVTDCQISLSPKCVSSHSEKLNENAGKEQSVCYAKSDIATPDRIGSTDHLSGGLLIVADIPPIVDVDPCDCRIVFAKIPDSERLPSGTPAESASVAALTQMNEGDESSSKSDRNFRNFAKEKHERADLATTRSWNSASESTASSTLQKCGYNRQSQSHLGDSSYVKTLKLSSSKSGGCMSSKPEHPSASSHCITKEKINPDIVLEQQCWYHGSIGRIEAEELLQPEKDGSFLVRISESSKLDYSLSLKSGRGFLHMKIVNLDGKFILGQFSQPFDSIPQMIEFYCMSKLPIKGNENISLIHPLANGCSL